MNSPGTITLSLSHLGQGPVNKGMNHYYDKIMCSKTQSLIINSVHSFQFVTKLNLIFRLKKKTQLIFSCGILQTVSEWCFRNIHYFWILKRWFRRNYQEISYLNLQRANLGNKLIARMIHFSIYIAMPAISIEVLADVFF